MIVTELPERFVAFLIEYCSSLLPLSLYRMNRSFEVHDVCLLLRVLCMVLSLAIGGCSLQQRWNGAASTSCNRENAAEP